MGNLELAIVELINDSRWMRMHGFLLTGLHAVFEHTHPLVLEQDFDIEAIFLLGLLRTSRLTI